MAVQRLATVTEEMRVAALQEIRRTLYDEEAATAVRRMAQASSESFDATEFSRFVTDHPAFTNLHLVTADDE